MDVIYHFWGKAAGEREGEPASHPLVYHCLDVAAVADALLAQQPQRLATLASLMRTTPENARHVLVALIALHDVGKFAEAFQCKCEAAWPASALGPFKEIQGPRHDKTGFDMRDALGLLEHLFAPAFSAGWNDPKFRQIWGAVAAHHGKPVEDGAAPSWDNIPGLRSKGLAAARHFSGQIAEHFGPFAPLAKPDKRELALASWLIAGLTVLADWLGSSRHNFPYQPAKLAIPEYWSITRKRADEVLVTTGLAPVASRGLRSPTDLFAFLELPSPLQVQLWSTPLPEGPMLAIVEDVTGSGKTEAALLLASRLMQAERASGVFMAMPTMATANAMYGRVEKCYGNLFAAEASLVLAHGRRDLNPSFLASIGDRNEISQRATSEDTGDEASASCSAWIADDRRKAFLADVGVGTIDQAFLGVLPSRHQALRLWGLADRVLIVDEAHAYDAYMGRELERLLEFHAALGGSAIVLSATLPQAQRRQLAAAFQAGLGTSCAMTEGATNYPLVTTASRQAITATAVATRPDRSRQLPVRRIASAEAAVAEIAEHARKGASIAYIRNSVDDAIEACETLSASGVQPILLHARFAMGDRLAIEERVMTLLGKSSTPETRRGVVLVGTQVLEQSLDYDVDCMFSDLSPIDLIVQRAGRLWRHADRGNRPVEKPELVVISPDPAHVENADWYAQVSRRAAAVYRHHGIVWRSACAIIETGLIETPGGIRALIEAVYGPDAVDVPEPLQRASNEAEGKAAAGRSIAGANLLRVEKGYGGEAAVWQSETGTPTRLAEPVTLFRVGEVISGAIQPLCRAEDGDLRRSWALSEVLVATRRVAGVPDADRGLAPLIAIAKASWPEWEREQQPLLVLDRDGDGWRGATLRTDGQVAPVVYDRQLGFRFEP